MKDPRELKTVIETAFPTQFNIRQLWALVLLCKFVRLRARNNSAFNNLFNTLFGYARFKQVTKTRSDGTSYPGLDVAVITTEPIPEEELGFKIPEGE
jgi:hypothetical protein